MTTLLVAAALLSQFRALTASTYSDFFEGRQCADGSVFSQQEMTCASNDYPLGARLRIYTDDFGNHINVVNTDRIHKRFTGKRIDLTRKASYDLTGSDYGLWAVWVVEL